MCVYVCMDIKGQTHFLPVNLRLIFYDRADPFISESNKILLFQGQYRLRHPLLCRRY